MCVDSFTGDDFYTFSYFGGVLSCAVRNSLRSAVCHGHFFYIVPVSSLSYGRFDGECCYGAFFHLLLGRILQSVSSGEWYPHVTLV